jgi:phospholipase/lecithinase/hemolysin
MTTNERLFVAGLLDQFDRAARHRNKTEMAFLLTQVQISAVDAEKIADSILANPKAYGF